MHPNLRLVVVSKNGVTFVLIVLIVTIVVVVFVDAVVFVVVVVVVFIILHVDVVILVEITPPLPRRHPVTNPISAINSSDHKRTIVCELKIIGRDNRRQTTSGNRGRFNSRCEGPWRRRDGFHFM